MATNINWLHFKASLGTRRLSIVYAEFITQNVLHLDNQNLLRAELYTVNVPLKTKVLILLVSGSIFAHI